MIEFDMFLIINIVIMFISSLIVIMVKVNKLGVILAGINGLAWLGYAIVMQKYIAFATIVSMVYVLICLSYGVCFLKTQKKSKT